MPWPLREGRRRGLTGGESSLFAGASRRVSEGTRTPDRLDHNQELYQLSYAHREVLNLAAARRPAIMRP